MCAHTDRHTGQSMNDTAKKQSLTYMVKQIFEKDDNTLQGH